LVEDDLKLEPKLANDIEHELLLRLPRRDDHAPDRQRLDAPRLEPLDEQRRRRLREKTFDPCGGIVEQRAVLRDDSIEHVELTEDALQVVELAPCDEYQSPARLLEPAQSGERLAGDDAAVRKSSIVIGGEREEIHAGSSDQNCF